MSDMKGKRSHFVLESDSSTKPVHKSLFFLDLGAFRPTDPPLASMQDDFSTSYESALYAPAPAAYSPLSPPHSLELSGKTLAPFPPRSSAVDRASRPAHSPPGRTCC